MTKKEIKEQNGREERTGQFESANIYKTLIELNSLLLTNGDIVEINI